MILANGFDSWRSDRGVIMGRAVETYNDNKQIKDYSICLENVRFSYREKEVLHGVNLKIESGTVNALVGPSGSGKSTIAKLIASLWDVDSGSIKSVGLI